MTIGGQRTEASDSPVSKPGTIALDEIVIVGRLTAAEAVYNAPRSSVYISGEQLERYGVISPTDVLRAQPGIQTGDSRNGGGLDVNIRGIQGQSRVAVTIDGTQQALDVYRDFEGVQQRSYIDPDLISDVTVRKGPSLLTGTGGAIGGTVNITTLMPDDILLPGKNYGVRLKGELWDNGLKPQRQAIAHPVSFYQLPTTPRDGREGPFGSNARSGSIAVAYRDDRFDLVVAYSQRSQGNYVAGKNGYKKYAYSDTFKPGHEVFNTSSDTKSVLLKGAIRLTDEQSLALSYRYFDGRYGEVMPLSSYFGLYQLPPGGISINSASAQYSYKPVDNDLIDLKANLWFTNARSDQVNGMNAPESQRYDSDYNWSRLQDLRIGGEISNRSKFSTGAGIFDLDLGASFQHEDIRPQNSVLITTRDYMLNQIVRDARRYQFDLSGKLEYKPIEKLQFWVGGRYSLYGSHDRNAWFTPRTQTQYGRWISVSSDNDYGYMFWRPDANGQFTNATDPRRNNGSVFRTTTYPFEGVPYNDFGATSESVFPAGIHNMVVGFDRGRAVSNYDRAFSPAFGVNYEFAPRTFLYVRYTEGIRLPSLFETSLGIPNVAPGATLKPERSRVWEIGASTTLHGLVADGDVASFKLAYFDTNIKNYIVRYHYVSIGELSPVRNAGSYKVNGLEFQSSYKSERLFADLSATYYLRTQSCDRALAAELRNGANGLAPLEVPDCTAGSYRGSYINRQNPPKFAASLTVGGRFLDGKLTVGGRATYTSGATDKLDKPWQSAVMAILGGPGQGNKPVMSQIEHRPVAVFDAFLSYKLSDHAVLTASVQNITDRYYVDPLAQGYMPAPGRMSRLSLTTKF